MSYFAGTSLSKHVSLTRNSKRPPSCSSSGFPATGSKSCSPSLMGSAWLAILEAVTLSAHLPLKLRSECMLIIWLILVADVILQVLPECFSGHLHQDERASRPCNLDIYWRRVYRTVRYFVESNRQRFNRLVGLWFISSRRGWRNIYS